MAKAAFAQEATPPAATSSATTMETSDISVLNMTGLPFLGFGRNMMMGEAFGGPKGRHGSFGGPMGYIEVSAEYNQTINNILDQDTDVQNLISQGYNITSVRPILSSTIGVEGKSLPKLQ